ncbi:hypothetical protein MHK_000237 [Candidatus Magnetomorum sp. HK-1]|nr:hypothetical protein MHK_000237 [Candidatus Magnetomorum sp. HK-1]
MRFITSFELLGMEKGKIIGQIEALKQMFKMKYLQKKQFDKLIQPLQLKLAQLTESNQKINRSGPY